MITYLSNLYNKHTIFSMRCVTSLFDLLEYLEYNNNRFQLHFVFALDLSTIILLPLPYPLLVL